MIFAASMLVLGFALGFLVPRDAFPWMQRLSAWLMRNRDNRSLGRVLVGIALAILVALVLAGCQQQGRRIVEAQTPGQASGAGATFTGPANSAAPSTQKAKRRTVYQKQPGWLTQSPPVLPTGAKPVTAGANAEPAQAAEVAPGAPPAPPIAWSDEETETTFGQHQDAAGIVKVAIAASSWSGMRWFGIFLVLVCIGGLLWSHENPNGYPVIFWKIGGCGVFFIIVADNPAWLLLLLLPLGFYVVQKMNLLRVP